MEKAADWNLQISKVNLRKKSKIHLKNTPSPEALKNLCKYAELLINQCLNCNLEHCHIMDVINLFIEKYSESIGIQIYFNFIRNSLENEKVEEWGRKVLLVLLESRKGLIDNFLPEIIELARLISTGNNYWELLCIALWNNSKIVLMELKQQNYLDPFIEFINLNNHCIREGYLICGICSLFLAIDETLPSYSIRLSSMLKLILSLWTRMYGRSIEKYEDEYISENDEEKYEYNLNYPFFSMLFREVDFKKFIWSSIANFRHKNSDLYREIKRSLNEQEILTLRSIISD